MTVRTPLPSMALSLAAMLVDDDRAHSVAFDGLEPGGNASVAGHQVDLIRHWRQRRPAKLQSVCRCSLQPMFGLDQPPAPWRLVRLEARRDARFSSVSCNHESRS